ncbi:hypothetical protein E3C22_24320 [Jiella endophytica]|uniref:Uncharacterized protein n=1 Tax=Jiella endophytica TaxID=2558362 RepID=A0A4Y8R8J5_9HYPH|nr:hypothetical protein [Jiella endophytica]TFF17186.1 hypothetical protein E3C22_24320 [Jiella endophytica]
MEDGDERFYQERLSEMSGPIEIEFDEVTMRRLSACAAWRQISVPGLVRAYVEDWIDIDYPESRGRHTSRGLRRDGPIGLCDDTARHASRNWMRDLGEDES